MQASDLEEVWCPKDLLQITTNNCMLLSSKKCTQLTDRIRVDHDFNPNCNPDFTSYGPKKVLFVTEGIFFIILKEVSMKA